MATLPLLLALALAQTAGRPQVPASVLIFTLDDIANVDVSTYGGPALTPTLDMLAAQGVRFLNHQASPTCAPTRRELLTGKFWWTGNGIACALPEANTPAASEVLLPEAMPSYSSALLGKWHLGGAPSGGAWELAPIEHGFDFWLDGMPANVTECGGTGYSNWLRVTASATGHSSEISTQYSPAVTAVDFVQLWPTATEPRLAVVGINLAHAPFHVPPPYALPAGYPTPVTARQKYEAMIVAYDRAIGSMLSVVDMERTLVVVVSDNGTPPNVAGVDSSRAKGTTFRRGVNTPLIIAGACVVNPGRLSTALVCPADVFATAVAVAGGGQAVDGVSLLPILQDQAGFVAHDLVLCGNAWGSPDGDVAAVSLAYKLRRLDPDGDKAIDSEELYDLAADPGELVNEIQNPNLQSVAESMRAWLGARLP